ncbi:MAG TPA: hypothetical protein VGP87_05270 [Gemmatimonadales bacterium]|nr:hypothetical protein [Gemmatimonadales bacterium]
MKNFGRRAGLILIGAAFSGAAMLDAQAPTTTVGGVAYAGYFYQLKDTANHVNNFDVTRAYVNVIGKFAYGIGTRVTADIFRSTDGSLSYRLKYAFATWTPNDGKSPLTFKLGQIHTPLLDWEEGLWDYRMQGQMAMERAGYVSSSDFGAGIDGNWLTDRINMQVGVYNGENYNKAPGDQRKDLMGRLSVQLMKTDFGGPRGGLRITGYGQVGKPTGGGTRQRFLGMASYRSKALTLAAEYASTKDSVFATPITAGKKGRVISAFGVVRIPPSYKVQIIGRFDSTDPNTSNDNDRTTRIIAGVAYQISANLRILGDIDNLAYQGGVTTPANEAVRSQALFQIQFTF